MRADQSPAVDALEAQAEQITSLKSKLTARAKSMLRLRDILTFIVDELDDEGDRVYFGSSNHAEQLRELAEDFDAWHWDDIIADSKDVDYSSECASLRARLAELEQAAAPFVRAWGDELFQWPRDDLERFRRDGIPTSNPRYGDDTPIYCVIEPGKDHEDRSDDYLFTVGELRTLARVLEPKE